MSWYIVSDILSGIFNVTRDVVRDVQEENIRQRERIEYQIEDFVEISNDLNDSCTRTLADVKAVQIEVRDATPEEVNAPGFYDDFMFIHDGWTEGLELGKETHRQLCDGLEMMRRKRFVGDESSAYEMMLNSTLKKIEQADLLIAETVNIVMDKYKQGDGLTEIDE